VANDEYYLHIVNFCYRVDMYYNVTLLFYRIIKKGLRILRPLYVISN